MPFRSILLILLGLFMGACASAPVAGPAPVTISAETAPAVVQTVDADAYKLGSGDRIRLTVFGEDDLSGEFAVDGAGQVSLPLIGEVPALGLTVREFQAAVDARLREGYLKDPRVSAEVAQFRPFYILGEVEKPGTYPYTSGLTVLNAVATAQGFTYRANERVVYIRRLGEEEERKVPLTSATPVNPGDTIRIGERFF